MLQRHPQADPLQQGSRRRNARCGARPVIGADGHALSVVVLTR